VTPKQNVLVHNGIMKLSLLLKFLKEVDFMLLENTLKNGVKVYALEVESDFEETQRILDINDYTQNIDGEYAYKPRVSNDFVGTYSIKVDKSDDYNRFIDVLVSHKQHARNLKETHYNRMYSVLRNFYLNNDGAQNDRFYWHHSQLLSDWFYNSSEQLCNCSICSFRFPTIEEWKTNKYFETEKRQLKLGKALRKAGFEQSVIDFYSLQTKVEKDIFFTVSDLPQHIVGMSYYCELGEWDGFGGSSCQDTRHNDEDYPIKLGGALHDNKLFVGMLHDKYEDLENMENKLLARVLFRLVHVDGEPLLFPTYYYGNNDTKDILHNALKALHEVDIYSNDIRDSSGGGSMERVYETANGTFQWIQVDEVHIRETIETEKRCSCPMCSGSGEYEVWSDKLDKYVEVNCPCCDGDGEVYYTFYQEIDEWKEIETTTNVYPYIEGYSHNGGSIEVYMNVGKVRDARNAFKTV
jgi:hypothetical protein